MTIRLMTSNIWGDYFGNEVSGRDEKLERVYRRYMPDVLGLQEMTDSWHRSPVWERLRGEYAFVPVPTEENPDFTPLLYRKGKLSVVDSCRIMYHTELDRSKGITWAVFSTVGGHLFAVFNTHFMWRDGVEYDVIRRYNAMELVGQMRQVKRAYDCPCFFMGDLNCTVDSPAWKYLTGEGYLPVREVSSERSEISSWHGDPVRGEDRLFHGSMTSDTWEKSIDHIGAENRTAAERYIVVTDQDALDATDHSPVFADIEVR